MVAARAGVQDEAAETRREASPGPAEPSLTVSTWRIWYLRDSSSSGLAMSSRPLSPSAWGESGSSPRKLVCQRQSTFTTLLFRGGLGVGGWGFGDWGLGI